MKKTMIPLAAFGLLVLGCDGPNPTTPAVDDVSAGPLFATANPVVHRASLGSPDACEAFELPTGCDANFSLVANQRADGRVTGQWHDQFARGDGIHVVVDCLVVVGNQAWVSGVGPMHPFGNEWVTRVADNGRSANDPADQISFSIPVGVRPNGFEVLDCNGQQPFPLLDLAQGQVTVW